MELRKWGGGGSPPLHTPLQHKGGALYLHANLHTVERPSTHPCAQEQRVEGHPPPCTTAQGTAILNPPTHQYKAARTVGHHNVEGGDSPPCALRHRLQGRVPHQHAIEGTSAPPPEEACAIARAHKRRSAQKAQEENGSSVA